MITVIFDTETNGLIKPEASRMDQQPYITEIFCLKVEHVKGRTDKFKIIGEFESLVNIPVPLSPEITKITGLTDADLATAPKFSEIAQGLCEFFVGVDRVVAHNLAFDRSMLANDMSRVGRLLKMPWPPEHICTVEKTLHIEQRRMSLTNLHKHLFNGEGFPDAHRAKNDVMPLYECYKSLVRMGTI